MTLLFLLATRNRSRDIAGFKYRLLMACCIVLLTIGVALWWNRSFLMQLALQQFLERTSLLSPKISGVRFGFDQAVLSEMEFAVGTGAGLLSVNMEDIKIDYNFSFYGFKAPDMKAVNIGHARLKFAYHAPTDQSDVKGETYSGTMAYPLTRLSVDNLDVESNTPWGLTHFSGSMEIKREKTEVIEAKFQDAKHAIQIELDPGLRSAKVIAQHRQGEKIFEMNATDLDRPDKSVVLRADVGAAVDWLSTSSLVPETWRTNVATSVMPRMASGISATHVDLTIKTLDSFGTAAGRALLTRDSRYLARSDWSMPKPGTVIADGHLDMAATEVIGWLNPWLSEIVSGGKITSGNVQGTMKLLWQRSQIISGAAHLKLSDVAWAAGSLRVEHGNIKADINDLTNPIVALSADAPILGLGKEIAARNLIIRAHFLGRELTMERAALSLFGGFLEVLPSTVKLDQQPVLLTLRVSDIDLSQLLSTLHYEDLKATGTVSGELPLRLAQHSIELQDGLLNGTRPGILRYQGPVADNENIAFRALRNLEYHSLQAKVNFRPDGDYHLGLRLQGSNPEVLSGHPLAFNLNLSGHLPELLQKGFMAGDFERLILEEAKPKSANTKKTAKQLLPPPIFGEQQLKPQSADQRSQ